MTTPRLSPRAAASLRATCSEPSRPLDTTSPGEIRREREGTLEGYYDRQERRHSAEWAEFLRLVRVVVVALVAAVGWCVLVAPGEVGRWVRERGRG